MMKVRLLLAITAILAVIVTGNVSVSAQTPDLAKLGLAQKSVPKKESKKTPKRQVPKQAPTIEEYVVVEGDTLKSVSDAHTTTWQRLYAKNPDISNPDLIKPGEKLIIPHSDEVLPDRALPTPVTPAPISAPAPNIVRAPVSGNTYEPGQCTWYVKSRRPDLPNDLGDASSWLYNAQAQGMATGSTPRVGAVGWSPGHVVYVESVNGDGTVTISDMNGRWVPYELGNYTYPASKYVYIY